MSYAVTVLLALGLAYLTGATQPSYPVYPDQFTQNYTDVHYDSSSTSVTRGMYMYDITNNRMLNARENGRNDLFCGPEYPNINTPCSHIVVGGNRFLYYPEMSDCCFCCNSAQGCGLLKADWLTGASYEGQIIVHLNNGTYENCYVWKQMGNDPNFYYETIADNPLDRVMVELYMPPGESIFYDTDRVLSVDDSQLQVPSICSLSKGCPGYCEELRMSKADPRKQL